MNCCPVEFGLFMVVKLCDFVMLLVDAQPCQVEHLLNEFFFLKVMVTSWIWNQTAFFCKFWLNWVQPLLEIMHTICAFCLYSVEVYVLKWFLFWQKPLWIPSSSSTLISGSQQHWKCEAYIFFFFFFFKVIIWSNSQTLKLVIKHFFCLCYYYCWLNLECKSVEQLLFKNNFLTCLVKGTWILWEWFATVIFCVYPTGLNWLNGVVTIMVLSQSV